VLQHLGTNLVHALLMALGMVWQTGWTLVLGLTISALLQTRVSTDQMRTALGRDGLREIALATIAGAASSSCSYASAAINYTFWLDLVFGALAIYCFWLNHRHPMRHHHAG